jgi:predicted amidohydrolase
MKRWLIFLGLLPLALRADIAFTVASLKVMPVLGDKAGNYARFEKLAREAAARGADLIVTPEGYLDGYAGGGPKQYPNMDRAKLAALAEPIDGPAAQRAAALARELHVHVIFCFTEKRGAKLHNTAAIFAPDGSLVGRYSKSHIAGGEIYDAGDELPVFNTALGRMGVLICFDRQPPENARTLALRGAQFIVVPAYGKKSTVVDEDIMLRTRALENGIYVIYTSPRNAFVADPVGEISGQERSNTDGLVFGRIVLDARIGDRNSIKVRRPELYGELVAPVAQHP